MKLKRCQWSALGVLIVWLLLAPYTIWSLWHMLVWQETKYDWAE